MIKAIAVPPSLVQQVYETIRDAICIGEMLPGERVAEDVLARRLNVSRQPVHQALAQLFREGFLCRAGKRGLAVAPISLDMVAQVYELRAALESHAAAQAALAVRQSGPIERTSGEALLLAGQRALATHDIAGLIEADFRFHRYLYGLAGNALIEATASTNWHHVRRIVMALTDIVPDFPRLWCEHAKILDAVVSGDPTRAAYLARNHVEQAIAALRRLSDMPGFAGRTRILVTS